ncbi:M3 family oligoendopeptidase [Indiicoccus explosivorum]|uniref:M3 family oligoendopeptidase n=1 Tax=Indiicoccus explosivorum TaxID=1917864 RepID=UPI000B448AC5|nr:M3 family oligoendopeptidase [Indiicoccus explosivorum]
MRYEEKWDLDSIFQGGSQSAQLREHLKDTAGRIGALDLEIGRTAEFQSGESAPEAVKLLALVKQAALPLSQAASFIGCLQAQDTADRTAGLLQSELTQLSAQFESAMKRLEQLLVRTSDPVWEELTGRKELSEFRFILNEWREQAKLQLSEQEEQLISALSTDGYHGWSRLYDMLVSDIHVELEAEGEKKKLSVGQAENLSSHSDESVRKEAFEKLEEEWSRKENYFAETLNHIAGFRLSVYRRRGWDDVLQEPLHLNRMSRGTLDAMWNAISRHKAPFRRYLDKKARLLGKTKLDWFDLDAPTAKSAGKLPYQEAAEFILKHFGSFGSELADFSRKAFEGGWIEAEDRPGKMPGGFCTGFPQSGQSRIFMTYSGSMSGVSTLAHELGHAFHSFALQPVHYLNRQYAMNVAETASTFAEMIVADAAVREAATEDERLALLEDKVQRSVAFFMNIHARFLFETRFYEERKSGFVPAERLNVLMEQAQQEAFADGLSSVHPHFWASKLHFYITDIPFYNFPYTFGYLFSLSVYAKALEEGEEFEQKYISLLRDTAVMTTEELALKHLGEDITQETFWEKGISLCVEDVEAFLELASVRG